MKRHEFKIALLTTLALILVPATVGADDSHRHHGRDEHHGYHAYSEHHGDHEFHGGRLGTFKAKLAESNCSSLEGRARGTCYAYCEVLNCSSDANSGKRLCVGLSHYFQRITQSSVAPPCTGETQTTTSEPASCPCYSDLSQEGFTDQSTCSNDGTVALIVDLTTFHMAQAGATNSFMGCDLDGATQQPIPSDQASACVNIITESNLCAPTP